MGSRAIHLWFIRLYVYGLLGYMSMIYKAIHLWFIRPYVYGL